MNIELPGWLDACRPDDALYADAYEGTPAELRALLKTAIAFAFHRWPPADDEEAASRRSARSGFSHSESSRPAGWAIASLGPGFASPARLLAALVPAVLAGVERMVVVSEAPFSPAVCAALELAGLEDSFLLDGEQMPGLYEDMRTLCPEGRVLAFPGAEGNFTPAQQELLHSAALDGMPRLRDLPSPRILCLHTPGSFHEESLRWLQPDAEFLREPAPDIRAAYVPGEASAPGGLPFVCGPGMEACWPGPSPEFYRTRTCSAFLFQKNDPEALS